MKQEGYQPENQKIKPINIDIPNEFDTSKVEKDIKILEEAIRVKNQELIELQNKRHQINERDEEMIEKYDVRIDQLKTRLSQLENLLKSDQTHLLEVSLSINEAAAEMFGGDKDKPQIIQ
jgi:hypothetical protein